MKAISSSYSLEGVRLKRVDFKALTDSEVEAFNKSPGRISFSRTVEESSLSEERKAFCVSLEVHLYNEDRDDSFLMIEMEGKFIANADMPKDLMDRVTAIQAPAILFPYVRQFVSVITLNSNMSPLTLPLINMGAAMKKAEEIQE